MKVTNKERGANVRRNLRRWRKPLIVMNLAWLMLLIAVCVVGIVYAYRNHLSNQRVQMLGSSCGMILIVILGVAWLIVLLAADRKKSE